MNFNKKRIKSTITLIFLLLLPIFINITMFSNFNQNHNNIEDILQKDPPPIPNSSNSPPNDHYFNFYKIITVDSDKISGTNDLIDFPLLVSILDPDLRVQVQSNGNDIAFSNGTDWLDHEIELFEQDYDPDYAKLVAWVRIPVLSWSEDTIIYMYYGNSTMGSRENPTGVWDSNYVGVWHLSEQSGGALQIKDSTMNSNDGTDYNGVLFNSDGQIAKSTGFNDALNQRIEITDDSSLHISDKLTVEAWINPTVVYKWMSIVTKMDGDWNSQLPDNEDLYSAVNDNGRLFIGLANSGSYYEWASNVYISAGTWQHIVFTYDSSTSICTAYKNGDFGDDRNFGLGTLATNTRPLYIGFNRGWLNEVFDGTIDEVRVSKIVRSDDWIRTEYRNHNDPDSFYSVTGRFEMNPPKPEDFLLYKKITIDSDKVSGSNDLVDFPLLISLLDSDLKNQAQPDGDDIAFWNGSEWLDHEIELYDPNYSPTEAQLIAWVRIPLLSPSTNTSIFMFYGNSTMVSRENPTGVWDSNYKGVWHLKEDPGLGNPGDIKDSTTNSNHGTTFQMSSSDQEPGQIDGSFGFDGNADPDDLTIPHDIPEIKTIEFWMNPDAISSSIATETSYHSPTATGDVYNNWISQSNPTYAYTSNNTSVYRHIQGDQGQDYYNFNLNIPANVDIEGIEVSIEGRRDPFFGNAECTIELSWNGGTTWTTSYKELIWWSTLDSYLSAGGSTDLWGKPSGWVPSHFNNANFRVLLRESGYNPLYVDHVRVKVYYSIPSDMPLIDVNGTAQIVVDNTTSEIKTIGFPNTPDIYVNGTIKRNINTHNWYHVAITDTSGVDVSDLLIGRASSMYFDGNIDEVRLSDVVRSADWIATEYNNQYDPDSFYTISAEKTSLTDVQVNAIDLYGNIIPYVNISIIENNTIISSDIADANGAVIFEDIFSIEKKYNFSVSMTSNIVPYQTIEINRTLEAILIEGSFQTVNLICNISRNVFNIVDADGIPVDSGWIIVGKDSDQIQNCTINATGHATFRWLNITPYEYNYTVWYRDLNYNPNEIVVGSGKITTPNSEVDVTTILTTVNFTVLAEDSITPIDGVRLLIKNLDSGESTVNLTTDLNGKATFRWVNSSGINDSNYSIKVSFYANFWPFNISKLNAVSVIEANFTLINKAAYDIIVIFSQEELQKLETKIISLNPTSDIRVDWGSKLKLRALFNVTKVPTGFENLIGPSYADSISCQIFEGLTLIQSNNMPTEEDYIGRHQVEIETDELECETPYIIKINAYKSGYVLPPEVIMSLFLLENEVILNQSGNDDSLQSAYWQEITSMSVKPYGTISEDFSIEYNIYDNLDHTIEFSIPDISNDWNLSQITFNIYNITWNTPESNINIIIVDPYGSFNMFHYNNHSGHNYGLGTWTGIMLNLGKSSPTNNNTFEFSLGGSFDGTIDIIADATFIMDK
ncbi:MAG: DUF2341 domain-containing protein, partial [Candidatus Hodarchaeota archaeon]